MFCESITNLLETISLSFSVCFQYWPGLHGLTGTGKPECCTKFPYDWHGFSWMPFLIPAKFYMDPEGPYGLKTAEIGNE